MMDSYNYLNVLSVSYPSLYIPYVFANVTSEYIVNIFNMLEIGEINRVDIVPKNNGTFNCVFIHFKKWNTSKPIASIRDRLKRGEEIKIIVEHNKFWKLRKSYSPSSKETQIPRFVLDEPPLFPYDNHNVEHRIQKNNGSKEHDVIYDDDIETEEERRERIKWRQPCLTEVSKLYDSRKYVSENDGCNYNPLEHSTRVSEEAQRCIGEYNRKKHGEEYGVIMHDDKVHEEALRCLNMSPLYEYIHK